MESTLTGTNLWYIAHVRKRFIALEALMETLERQSAAIEAQATILNEQLSVIRRELREELITSTEEVQLALHQTKDIPKTTKPSVAF